MLTLTKSLFALMLGFIGATIFGLIIIPFLKKLKAGQNINIYVEAHRNKAGTPTMGGLIFIIPTFAITLFLLLTGKIEYSVNLVIVLFVFLSYGLIGFLDDFISLRRKTNKGLTQFQKILLQLIVALVFYVLFRQYTAGDSYLRISALGIDWNLGWFYGVFILFLLVGSSNAVNLTDGLDGLVSGLGIISFGTYAIIAWQQKQFDILLVCVSTMGALLGFFLYNKKPAKIFMGDVGSLALGGMLAAISILLHQEWTLLLIGLVYVLETASVMLQVGSFKLTGKRIFKMSPVHHHFELSGWSEWKIDIVFWIVGLVMSALTLGILYL